MGLAKEVLELEQKYEALQKKVADAVEFMRTVSWYDARSVSFIVNRILVRLGEPENK